MKGPQSTQELVLFESPEPELLWIVAYEATMVAPDGETPRAQDFMCHSNLDFDPALHNRVFGDSKPISSRLFTLSQGQLSVRFPEGFGLPLLSHEPLKLTTQVLNLNHHGDPVGVRHRIRIEYLREAELDRPMQALFAAGAYGLRLLEGTDGYFNLAGRPDPEEHGPGCLPGLNADKHAYEDAYGRSFTGHWVVKPGREETRTLVTHLLNLPFDTTVHAIAVHLHPFAASLELRDLTTGRSVWKSGARQFPDRIGLAHVDSYSSVEGLPLYKGHDYEIVSVYNNTSGADQDSMAVMNLYLLDKGFKDPTGSRPR
jgi:hypothetical protein